MTEFERQVVEALKTIPLAPPTRCYGDSVTNDEHHRVLYSVAPRVAAAIERTWYAAGPMHEMPSVTRGLILAALRGEP